MLHDIMKTVIFAAALLMVDLRAFVPKSKSILRGTERLKGNDLVDYVNKAQKLFTAKLSPRFATLSDETKRHIMGSKYVALPAEYRVNEKTHNDIDDSTIPESFDARLIWPECLSLNSIGDQSNCGSCWAIAAAEAMSDRICIASNGNQQVTVSADDILSCCSACDGCDGGDSVEAWKYWVQHGVVTGGNYSSKIGCKPYPYAPCEHYMTSVHYKQCPMKDSKTNACEHTCQPDYPISYNHDKHYGASFYAVAQNVTSIQKEIMLHGPVEVAMFVYEDFEHYHSGVYKVTAGNFVGGHAVKMIGWGTEDGTPYWICSNSWNSDWGENGFFRIRRGFDECGIESSVVAGLPKP